MKLYYWNAWGRNFGDELGPAVVAKLMNRDVSQIDLVNGEAVSGPGFRLSPKLLALGSILHHAGPGDVVWGAGMAPQNDRHDVSRHFPSIVFHAVRGPLTREFVLRGGGSCPEVYGDPGQLLAWLFPKYLRIPKQYEVTVIPHGLDESRIRPGPHVCSARQKWESVVVRIAASRRVISSSLHGIIVAEALGIPAAWLRHPSLPSFEREGVFKYNDYLLATGRAAGQFVDTIEEGVEQPLPKPQWDPSRFLAAFPRQLLSSRRRADC